MRIQLQQITELMFIFYLVLIKIMFSFVYQYNIVYDLRRKLSNRLIDIHLIYLMHCAKV